MLSTASFAQPTDPTFCLSQLIQKYTQSFRNWKKTLFRNNSATGKNHCGEKKCRKIKREAFALSFEDNHETKTLSSAAYAVSLQLAHITSFVAILWFCRFPSRLKSNREINRELHVLAEYICWRFLLNISANVWSQLQTFYEDQINEFWLYELKRLHFSYTRTRVLKQFSSDSRRSTSNV